MIEVIEAIRDNYFYFSQRTLNLVFIWMVFIFFIAKEKSRKQSRNLIVLSMCAMLFLIFPVTACFLMKLCVNEVEYYRYFYALPVLIVVGYLCCEIYTKTQKRRKKILCIGLLVLLMVGNINTDFTLNHIRINTNQFAVDSEIVDISTILKGYENIVMLAPDKVGSEIAEYDEKISLLTEPEIIKDRRITEDNAEAFGLKQVMSELTSNMANIKRYVDVVYYYDANCIVLQKEYDDGMTMQSYDFRLVGETEHYRVFIKI